MSVRGLRSASPLEADTGSVESCTVELIDGCTQGLPIVAAEVAMTSSLTSPLYPISGCVVGSNEEPDVVQIMSDLNRPRRLQLSTAG
jgi:hypothetical protein